ncbi:MAG: NDP-sugar synthase [Candidatus Bathyarchaeota archaeon]|nr:NDP-sugar synthase [Candidatus Bathyarchaeota archaeon]
MILIGGFGTRLRPLTCTRPKALFPIANKPLLQMIFEKLAENGFDEAILAVNALTEFHIKQQRLSRCGLKLKFSRDPPKMPLGTAGPIKKAEKLIGHEEPFLVLNGDILADFSYKELWESHNEDKAVATIALHEVDDPTRYGVAELAADNRIKRFIEKPAKGAAPTRLINAGAYVLSPKIFSYIPAGRAVSMEREVFPRLAEQKIFYGRKVSGLWIDMGKPEEYLQTNRIVLNTLRSKQDKPMKGRFEVKPPVAIDKGVVIGENSVIGPYAVLGRNVSVGCNVHISDSVVFADAKIGDFASVTGALIGEGVVVGKKTKIVEGCIIADQAKVKDGVALGKGVSVCPAKEICEGT